jgi:hypothetical protein
MKKVVIILVVFYSTFVFGQKQMRLENCTKFESSFLAKDSSHVYSLKSISEMQIVIHSRLNETFEINDTINRDYIESGTKKMTLDRLYGLLQLDYTGSYDLMDCYSVKSSTHSYCILSFVDLFIFGTNQQVFFVVMKQIGDNWEYYSSYENEHDRSTTGVKIRKVKNGEIKLKGKYLKQITRGSVIEP